MLPQLPLSLPAKAGLVALIALSVYVGAVRTVTRPSGPLCQPLGLSRWSLMAEADADAGKTPFESPPVAPLQFPAAPAAELRPPIARLAHPLEQRRVLPRPPKIPHRFAADSPDSD